MVKNIYLSRFLAYRLVVVMPPINRLSGLSGGALFHTGLLKIVNSMFLNNSAVQGGTAIFSIGTLKESRNVTFENNSPHCPAGQYGYDSEEVTQELQQYIHENCFQIRIALSFFLSSLQMIVYF